MTWNPNYIDILANRQKRFLAMKSSNQLQVGAKMYYKDHPVEFINHWCITYDPRNVSKGLPTTVPFIMFPKQVELIKFFHELIQTGESGLVEKSRDYGATWCACAFSVWAFLFLDGASIGWGSRKEKLVDNLGDPDSIFEKIRMLFRFTPPWFLPIGWKPKDHVSKMRIINPENSATITGEAGDGIGRGGRKSMYFKDESAWYEHASMIEAALGDNTDVQVDISSVKAGTVYERKRKGGEIWSPGKNTSGLTRVLILDWRDHPMKNQEWHDRREEKAKREGLLNVFRQEVDRDYTAAIRGILIPKNWVEACIDAHIKLKLPEPTGQKMGGFDVYDEGHDAHALTVMHGYLLTMTEEWHEGDTGQATRRVIRRCRELGISRVQYDATSVGAGVKSEYNRLQPARIQFVPWKSSFGVQDKNEYISEYDPSTQSRDEKPPKNKDFFANLKAQGGWNLRRRCEKTYLAVKKGYKFNPDELFSIPSELNNRIDLVEQLTQPTYKEDENVGKIMVNKKPDGAKSPNLFDCTMQASFRIKKFDPNARMTIASPGGTKIRKLVI